jgi:hypothetical protein
VVVGAVMYAEDLIVSISWMRVLLDARYTSQSIGNVVVHIKDRRNSDHQNGLAIRRRRNIYIPKLRLLLFDF